MEMCCILEVDVNGLETFLVDKNIVASFSSRLNRLFGKKSGVVNGELKVIFHDFPGGSEGFELMSRFCYNNGKVEINPHNAVLLNRVARFMELYCNKARSNQNLEERTENSLKGIDYWPWSELLISLKQCQDLFPAKDSSFLVQKIVDCITERLALPAVVSSCASSSDSSCYPCSSMDSVKSNGFHTAWWFEDLMFLEIDWLDKIVRAMVSKEHDHFATSRFLLYYQKSKSIGATVIEKRRILEGSINLLSLVDRDLSTISCKCLFELLCLGLRWNISIGHKELLESLIGSRFDQATVDHLLIQSPWGKKYAYDVYLIIRIIKAFLHKGDELPVGQLKKVGHLIDSYIGEVAADLHVKPVMFEELVSILPEAVRDSHDSLYRAIDIYVEVPYLDSKF
ncbi:BTB/POZ domain-containing protein At3g22104-like [Syzygium oleosum]|uniref:BTB/POZ domain-containing protein At3g22104-like n=1 Tax=Syzygium oleosum TaxID=219896 RepID=UPI0024BB4036|nr:BTB/POZ domain-containing protein At3g22104-like [Syzygium oleosum]